MGQRILIITHDYPPVMSARAFRWGAIAEYWAAHGDEVDVVCAWKAGLIFTEQQRGVQVYRVNALWLEKLRGWFKRGRSGGLVAPHPPTPTSGEGEKALFPLFMGAGQGWGSFKRRLGTCFIGGLRWLYRNVYRSVYWPDETIPFYAPAVKQAKTLAAQTPYDSIISVSPSFTAHLAGLRVHTAFPNLRWLADTGDPFSFLELGTPNNRWLYAGLNRRAERRIFRRADAVSVTTQPTQGHYADLFPDCAAKITVIPPLLSLDVVTAVPAVPPDHTIRLVFLGRLYADLRHPGYLLKLFASLLKTPLGEHAELHFYGDTREIDSVFELYKPLLSQKIILHGTVSREEAVRAMREASVLVNIGNKTPYQLPSKVVEYASMGKPVLNLTQIDNDSSAAFFQSYPAVLNLRETTESDLPRQVEQLQQFITGASTVETDSLRDWLAAFQIDAIGADYKRLLAP